MHSENCHHVTTPGDMLSMDEIPRTCGLLLRLELDMVSWPLSQAVVIREGLTWPGLLVHVPCYYPGHSGLTANEPSLGP